MLSVLLQAASNFCKHQLREECSIEYSISKMRMLIASIDVVHNETSRIVYIAMTQELVQSLCELFLFETQSDEETLQDMLLETTNMIVGSAKVLAQESGNQNVFTIKTPIFLETKGFDYPDVSSASLALNNGNILIAIKD